jgi:hypothetical protein
MVRVTANLKKWRRTAMERNVYYIEPRGDATDELLCRSLSVIEELEEYIIIQPGLISVRFKEGEDFSHESKAELKKIAYIHRDIPMEPCKNK